MKTAMMGDRELFDVYRRSDELKRLRDSFDGLTGRPIWWISFKGHNHPRALKLMAENSYEIWADPRVRRIRYFHNAMISVRRHGRGAQGISFYTSGGFRHFAVPLIFSGRRIGFLGLSEIDHGISQEILELFAEQVRLTSEVCLKAEELKRLSATIRPRAIALSTVHTVHRIINSTLNLNELVSRLAHLSAQVLRSSRCAIYLVERPVGAARHRASAQPKSLACKALVGYPKNRHDDARIPFGHGLEGTVARTAKTVLRRKLICIPLIDEDVIGVMTISLKRDGSQFTHFDQEILTTLAEEAVIAIKNAQLYEEQRRVTLGTIQSLAVILGTRTESLIAPEAFLRLVLKIAEKMRMNEEQTQALHYATLLKDTAKIGIPDEILKKPTKLTGDEYRLLRDHPIKGAKIVQSFESLKPVVPIILYSREKFDGTGYPKGLKGDRIPLGARILAVINAFEALIMGRPYRGRSSFEEALEEIVKNSGAQFDPKVVEAFLEAVRMEGPRRFLRDAKA